MSIGLASTVVVTCAALLGGACGSGDTEDASSSRPSQLHAGVATCPDIRRATKDIREQARAHRQRLRDVMVPDRPASVLLCRYFGPPGDAIGGARPQRVQRLATLANGSEPLPPGPLACLLDLGATVIAAFSYDDARRPVWIRIDLAGCRTVTNGPRTAAASEELRHIVDRLTADR